jgi:hypothetical protein
MNNPASWNWPVVYICPSVGLHTAMMLGQETVEIRDERHNIPLREILEIVRFELHAHQHRGNKAHHNRSNTRCNTEKTENSKQQAPSTYII